MNVWRGSGFLAHQHSMKHTVVTQPPDRLISAAFQLTDLQRLVRPVCCMCSMGRTSCGRAWWTEAVLLLHNSWAADAHARRSNTHTYIHIYIHIMHAYIHTYIHTYICMHTYACIHTCTNIHNSYIHKHINHDNLALPFSLLLTTTFPSISLPPPPSPSPL